MAFRDLLGAAKVIEEPTSILHGVFDKSKSTGHDLLVFENLVRHQVTNSSQSAD